MLGSDSSWTAPAIEAALREAVVDGLGLKPKFAFGPLRTAVSGRRVSPPLFESMEILGKTATLTRLARPARDAVTLTDVPAPAWAGVTGVLLDADDTLYDTRSAMHRAGAVAAAALWPQADPERSQRAGIRFRDDPEGHFAAYTRGEVEFAEMRRARIAELATWLDQGVDDDLWDAFEAAYEPAFLGALAAFDDVVPTLEALRARGCVVGVLTNSSGAYTTRKLAAAGLDGLFDVVCSTDTLGFGKPDPRAFHEACRLPRHRPRAHGLRRRRAAHRPARRRGRGDAGGLARARRGARRRGPPASSRPAGCPSWPGLGEVLALVGGDLGAGERTGSIFPRFA